MLFSEDTLYHFVTSSRLRYFGDRDEEGKKDGRGVCKWPDPPFGGGEQYLGLWRKDQPNTSGVFCWFFVDTYCGEFAEGGVFRGLGVYSYGGHTDFEGDTYWGSYANGQRTGLGDWLKGACHGLGSLTYTDGESFIGQWKHDKKHGLGRYTWGANTAEAGNYFQGEMADGHMEGCGASKQAEGGFHKIRSNSKVTQQYERGEFISSHPYLEADYCAIDLTSLEAEMLADESQQRAARVVQDVKSKTPRIKDVVQRASAARATAIYWASVALQLKAHVTAWGGLKGMI